MKKNLNYLKIILISSLLFLSACDERQSKEDFKNKGAEISQNFLKANGYKEITLKPTRITCDFVSDTCSFLFKAYDFNGKPTTGTVSAYIPWSTAKIYLDVVAR